MTKKILLLIVLVGLFNGCTRDDICDPNTPTTPLLIIRFKDIANATQAKVVPGLTVRLANDTTVVVVLQSTTDSIAIPLRNDSDITDYLFIRNTDVESNLDTLRFNYTRNNVYVNRACAYKTIYSGMEANLIGQDPNPWILNISILKPLVENDQSAHIIILH